MTPKIEENDSAANASRLTLHGVKVLKSWFNRPPFVSYQCIKSYTDWVMGLPTFEEIKKEPREFLGLVTYHVARNENFWGRGDLLRWEPK